ncbi:MAG: hypothetical protein MUE40_03665 [Anaerolineae bacterium]|nr:hypothetical protein [Anaerolineae bacterium]
MIVTDNDDIEDAMRIVMLFCLCLVVMGTTTAQEAPPASISPALQTYLETLEEITVGIRGLAALEPVALEFPTRDELLDYLTQQLDEALDEETVTQAMAFYTAFDFLPADLDLRATYLELYGQQVAGFYDTETRQMNVILISGESPGDTLPLLEQITFVHEYVHALQDQHFGLEAYLESGEVLENDDRALAMLALVEGDATLVMNTYTLRVAEENPTGALLQLLLGGLQAGNLTLPPGIPPIIAAELLFPYEAGQVFVEALFLAEGDWSRVDAAYADPPQSTEHILHPQKYLDGEMPVAVTLADNPLFPASTWSEVRQGVLGEFYLRQYLDTQLGAQQANQAAAGWGGDRYRVYRHQETGAQGWELRLVWDSPAEQTEFMAAYGEFMALRFPDGRTVGDCRERDQATLCATADADGVLLTLTPAGGVARR